MSVELPWVEPGGTFLGPSVSWEESKVVAVGVPLDDTTSFRPGTRFGPRRVREMSMGIEEYSMRLDRDLAEVGLHDAGDLVLAPGDVDGSLSRIEECVAYIAGKGKRIALLGGEHLMTYPVVRALVRFFPDLAVIQWDAHADRRQEYLGREMSHATVMHLIGRLGVPVYQMGVRSLAADELAEVRPIRRMVTSQGPFTGERYRGAGSEAGAFFAEEVVAPLIQVLPELKDRPLYVSCDIDVFDPAYAPGTGAPEPGGGFAPGNLRSGGSLARAKRRRV